MQSTDYPKRPERTRERDPSPRNGHWPRKVFYERPMSRPGSTQRLDITLDRLRVCILREGRLAAGCFFTRDDIEVLELAVSRTKTATETKNVGRCPMSRGGYFEIGSSPKGILIRFITDEDKICTTTMINRGEELIAFEAALLAFKEQSS